ncbi:hypothetical protein, partial [Klebsiella pneumoniae]|uniref:hypothetical protein n=1 Tax=Klebsiella pneumoniae TaxID=573 RepID=UPI0013C31E06
VKEGKVPEIKIPSVGDRLENNKPDEHPVFKDDTIYFKDEGDAPPVGKMPAVPNIKDWDGLKREDEISVEKEMKKDDEIKKDNEKKKDD